MIFAIVNNKYIHALATVIYALMVFLLIYYTYDIVLWKAAAYALVAAAVQTFTFGLVKFKTDYSFAQSFVPAMFCVYHLCTGKIWPLVLSVLSIAYMVWFFAHERYDTRDTTRFWVGLAVYMFTTALTAALIV